jgi:hypothetical protein
MRIMIAFALTCMLALSPSSRATFYGDTEIYDDINVDSVNDSTVSAHHSKEGFRHRYPHPGKNSFWKWQWERYRKGVPADPKEGYGFPVLRLDVEFLRMNRAIETITWLGHGTFFLMQHRETRRLAGLLAIEPQQRPVVEFAGK